MTNQSQEEGLSAVNHSCVHRFALCFLKRPYFLHAACSSSSGIYFSVCLALMVISLLETVIITNVLHHSSMKYQEVPNWVRIVVLKYIATMICYQWPEGVSPTLKTREDKPESSNGSTGAWVIQPVSQAADRHRTYSGGKQEIKMYIRFFFYLLLNHYIFQR